MGCCNKCLSCNNEYMTEQDVLRIINNFLETIKLKNETNEKNSVITELDIKVNDYVNEYELPDVIINNKNKDNIDLINNKQDKLSEKNAGTNVTITEIDGVPKINVSCKGTGDVTEEELKNVVEKNNENYELKENAKILNGTEEKQNLNTWIESKQKIGDYVLKQELIEGLDNKQDKLVNQKNIKSINGNSILGEGDIKTSIWIKGELKYVSDEITELPSGWKKIILNNNQLIASSFDLDEPLKFIYINTTDENNNDRIAISTGANNISISHFDLNNLETHILSINGGYNLWKYDPENQYSDLYNIIYGDENESWRNFESTRLEYKKNG